MQAVVLNQENEFPRYQTVPDPKPDNGELLVKVEYAGMNYADTMIRRGFYLEKPSFPSVVGFEFSGTVVGIGDGARPLWQGERVMGFCSGAYAQYVVIPEQTAIPVPPSFSLEEAAAFPCTFLTAYAMLRVSAKAVAGEVILIHAAGGGVGTAAIQLAKKLGLEVIAAAGSDEKLEKVKALGADFTINYEKNDFVEPVLDLTRRQGANVIFESIGGDFLEKDIQAAAPFARIVVFGLASGHVPPVHPAKLFKNSVSITGFWLRTLLQQPPKMKLLTQELLDLVKGENIRPIVGRIYPLQEAETALRALESRNTFGKLLLKP
ncbi:MAG: zinc-binding dehydrogenase [Terriglobia bacterium]